MAATVSTTTRDYLALVRKNDGNSIPDEWIGREKASFEVPPTPVKPKPRRASSLRN